MEKEIAISSQINDFEIVPSKNKREILQKFNNTAKEYPRDKTVHELFEEQVIRTPHNIALVMDNREITFEQLNKKANQLAYVLRRAGVKPDGLVGIMVIPGFEMIIGLLAILKAGGAYLPIDPDYPEERIQYMLDDSGISILVSDDKAKKNINFKGIELNLEDTSLYQGDGENLELVNKPSDLMYVIYTSGSTGKPKGVMLEHRGVVNHLWWGLDTFLNRKQLNMPLFTSFSFDLTVPSIYLPLIFGSKVIIYGGEQRASLIEKIVKENKVDVIKMTPAHFKLLKDINVAGLGIKRFIIAGEEFETKLAIEMQKYLGEDVEIYNEYGPTEMSVGTTIYKFEGNKLDLRTVPIGKPVNNLKIYILNENLEVLPVNSIGEIYISGDGIARGYLNNEQLTRDRFIGNPFEHGKRMYKTGDLAKWLPDGNIEFIGRVDNQVKINGFRIEIGEIENKLRSFEGISEAIVLERLDKEENKNLCAYIVSSRKYTVIELKEQLERTLPNYMIPAYFVNIEKLPLSPNGKLDRKALLELPLNMITGTKYAAPENDTQKEIIKIWKNVLDVNKIGIDDDFFVLGGNSLKSMRVVSMLHKILKVEVSISTIFNRATIRNLAAYISKTDKSEFLSIKPLEEKSEYISSAAQKRLYALEKLSEATVNYNIPAAFIIEGSLEKEKLRQVFKTLINRHEALRTSFILKNNELMQRISKDVSFDIEYEAVNIENKEEVKAILQKFIRPFKLEEAPLLRVKLIKLNENKHIFIYDMHHIIADGASRAIIMKEFVKLYAGEKLEELAIQYKDYSGWEAEMRKTLKLESAKRYWIDLYKNNVPLLNMPTDYKRSELNDYEGSCIQFKISAELTRKINKIAKSKGATLYMVLLAAYNILLSKYTGQEDIIVGSPVEGRQHAELKNIVGMFVNTLAMRNHPKAELTFADFLAEVKINSLKAFENQAYQFDELVDELNIKRELGRNPLFDTMFVLQNTDKYEMNIEGLKFEKYELDSDAAKFDMTLIASEAGEELEFTLEYFTSLFKKETVQRLADHFVNIITKITEESEIQLKDIELIDEEEKSKIINVFNKTKTIYPIDSTIPEIYKIQACKYPNKLAVICEGKSITYKQLDEKSEALAKYLAKKGVKADELVAVVVNKSIETIIAILAIIKSGAGYLPIDADYPLSRIKYMLEDSKVKIVLAQENAEQTKELKEYVFVDLKDESIYDNLEEELVAEINPNCLAYVIYTSGTTGRPKGVMVEHRNVIRLVKNTNYIQFRGDDKILQTGSLAFDASTFEVWGALLNGLTLHVASNNIILDDEKLEEYIEKNDITIMWLTSPLFNKICNENTIALKKLRCLLTGGDIVSPANVMKLKKIAPDITIVNGYGPTENTTFSTCCVIRSEEIIDINCSIPIGRPIANSTAYIFDKNMKLSPIGVPGELYVGGDGIGRGYANLEKLTKERFIGNPYDKAGRLYKTGDLVRWLENGNIEFLGRIDKQVKIRGFRIELAEVENNLLKIPGIKEAVVLDKANDEGKYLCAYYVSLLDYKVNELRKELSKTMPEYMLPSFYIRMDSIPLNLNGKVDINALPNYEGEIETGEEYVEPRNELEEKLVEALKEVLGLKKAGIMDNFFDLGGNSIKAALFIGKIHKELGYEIKLRDILRLGNILGISEYIKSKEHKEFEEIESADVEEFYEAASVQRRMYMIHQIENASIAYNIPVAFGIEGSLDVEKLEAAFIMLINRHEELRTSFHNMEGKIMKKVHSSEDINFNLQIIKLEEKKFIEEIGRSFITTFDLSTAPLMRAGIIQLDRLRHILLLDIHHIVADGASIEIIVKELMEFYTGKEKEPVKVSYRDFTKWQNKRRESTEYLQMEKFWLKEFCGDIPVISLPTDYQRPAVKSFEGDRLIVKIGEKRTRKLQRLARESGSTIYMVLLAVFNLTLSKYTGQTDIIIGTPVSGRNHKSIENVVGMFVNTLPVRLKINNYNKVYLYLKEVKEKVLKIFENEEYPFEELVNKLTVKRDISRNPLFDVLFGFESIDLNSLYADGINMSRLNFDTNIAKFDIAMIAAELKEDIELNVSYSTKLFKTETVERILGSYLNIIDEILENPWIEISDINSVCSDEKEKLLSKFNATDFEINNIQTIHELFEEQVKKTPDKVALVYKDEEITYRQLNEKANLLARVLVTKGVKAESIIGIMTERNINMITGLLAIHKAGGAYLPIDPKYPEERIKYMLENSKVKLILAENKFVNKGLCGLETVVIDKVDFYGLSKENLGKTSGPDNLAYVIYTSGTTGKPKGVCIEHKSAGNMLKWRRNEYNFTLEDTTLQLFSYVFDGFVTSFYTPLISGARVVILSEEDSKNIRVIKETIEKNRVTNFIMVPSMWIAVADNLDRKAVENLRVITLAGEALTEGLVRKCKELNENLEIVNEYGPTENTVVSTIKRNIEVGEKITIGKPRGNTRVYILDQKEKMVPIGVAGELCLSGEGLARGYLNNSKLTDEKFINNPYEKGERLYKTGDLAKWLSNGEIEFIGRKDNQVKIRGFRIELGEIENALSKLEGIKEAVVVDGGKVENNYICAYIVSDSFNEEEIREKLAAYIPDYMMPSYFVKLDALPLTVNGKVDRKLLPEPNNRNEYIMPRNEIEKKLAMLWEKVLQVERVGINDDFFMLGGQSIKAMMLTSMITREFNIEIKINDIFKATTIKKLAKLIEAGTEIVYNAIPVIQQKDFYEVSAAQKRMMILNRIEGKSINYNMPIAIIINCRIDRNKFEAAINEIVKRHEVLRTSFEFKSNEPIQIVRKEAVINVAYAELCEKHLDKYISSFIKAFNLKEVPLIRAALVKLEESKYAVVFDMHHIISDSVSLKNLFKEICELLEGKSLEPLRIQYKDFAMWQNERLNSDYGKRLEAYWLGIFKDNIPKLNMPLDYKRPSVQSFKGNGINFKLNKSITTGLKKLSEQTGATLYMLLLSVFNVLLSKYSCQEDIVVASPVSGRNHIQLENSIGMFINTLAMRNYPKKKMSFRQFLMDVRENTINAYDNQEYQFEELVSKLNIERDVSRNPICDVSFNMLNAGAIEFGVGEIKGNQYKCNYQISKYDFSLTAEEGSENIEIMLQYCTSLFKKTTMEKFADGFINITRQIIEDIDIEICKLEVNSEAEKKRILRDFNNTALNYEKEKTINRLFEEQAEKTPDKTAIECDGNKMTYRELNIKSNSLARVLRKNGICSDNIVPIMIGRGFKLIIGILGVLKAGAAYLPIDPDFPDDRVNYMLEDSEATVVVTEERFEKKLKKKYSVINIKDEKIWEESGENLKQVNNADNLAYVIYTSGSTGKPKGVAIKQMAVNNFIQGITNKINLDENKAILSVTTCSFDIFGLETLLPLTKGIKIILATEEQQKDPLLLNKLILETDADMVQTTPSRLKLMLKAKNSGEALSKLQLIMAGGEALPQTVLAEIKAVTNSKIYNMYGPTETTIWSAVKDLTEETDVTVGKPIANTQIYILDEYEKVVPIGVTGELCIAGDGLAAGYLNKEALTSEKFVRNPYLEGTRMYKTGDLAKWKDNGEIIVLGRQDNQVKIGGYRIELGEIEKVANSFDGIIETVAVGRKNNYEGQDLLLYYVANKKINIAELITFLSSQMPSYMLPQMFVSIDKIELNASGKVNLKALPEPDSIRPQLDSYYEETTTETQKNIKEVWSKLLCIKEIGINDNFFQIGGNSLKLIGMYNQIDKIYPDVVQVTDLFAYSTIYKLAEFIENKQKKNCSEGVDREVSAIKVLEEYVNNKNEISEENALRISLSDEILNRFVRVCSYNNMDTVSIILASFAFTISQISVDGNIALDKIINESGTIQQLKLDISHLDNFYDLAALIEKASKDEINEINVKRAETSAENNISVLFIGRSKVKKDYSYLYDLIMEVTEGDSEIQIIVEYNNEKLQTGKIGELFNRFTQLLETIINN